MERVKKAPRLCQYSAFSSAMRSVFFCLVFSFLSLVHSAPGLACADDVDGYLRAFWAAAMLLERTVRGNAEAKEALLACPAPPDTFLGLAAPDTRGSALASQPARTMATQRRWRCGGRDVERAVEWAVGMSEQMLIPCEAILLVSD